MRFSSLECYGIPKTVVKIWETRYGADLLPLQERAIRDYGVMEGKNLVAMGATSSGKTLIGEMAALQRSCRQEKTIFLVPLKALAEEKFRVLRETYGQYGIRTVISHRERREYDGNICRGNFDIAVLVYEKLQGLIIQNPELLREVRLIIVDELQMLGDEERGADLEMLLTQIIRESRQLESKSKPALQLIGLSAVLGNADEIANWLQAGLLLHPQRPVELRRGILCGTLFQYHETNSGKIGHEFFVTKNDTPESADSSIISESPRYPGMDPYHRDKIIETSLYLAEKQNESCLIFLPTKILCRQWAEELAERSSLPPAGETLVQLEQLEESAARNILMTTLKRGIAYHNGDLPYDLRHAIESGFRKGEIQILLSTSTLGQGLNLAARNTILIPEIYRYSHRTGGFLSQSIPLYMLENQGGRAGRLGYAEDFGRMILVAETEHEQTMLWTRYIAPPMESRQGKVQGLPFEPVCSPLKEQNWDSHLLRLITGGACANSKDLEETMTLSLSGWKLNPREILEGKTLKIRIRETLDKLIASGMLIPQPDGTYKPSPEGSITASFGVQPETVQWIQKWISGMDGQKYHPAEILLLLAFTPDAIANRIPVREPEIRTNMLRFRFLKYAEDWQLDIHRLILPLLDQTPLHPKEKAVALKKTLVLLDWISEIETADLETRNNLFIGTVRSLAEDLAWLVQTFAGCATLHEWNKETIQSLDTLTRCLRHGVVEKGLGLAALPIPGWSRNHVHSFLRTGCSTPAELRELPLEIMAQRIPSPLTIRLKEYLDRKPVSANAPIPFPVTTAKDRIVLTGRPIKRRTLSIINGKELEIPNAPYLVFLKLGRMLLQEKDNFPKGGWVNRDELDPSDHWRAISRLRTILHPHLLDPDDPVLENDGCGYYRLRIQPKQMTIDEKEHDQHWNHQFHPAVNPNTQKRSA